MATAKIFTRVQTRPISVVTRIRTVALSLACVVIAGCGGGGGDSAPPPAIAASPLTLSVDRAGTAFEVKSRLSSLRLEGAASSEQKLQVTGPGVALEIWGNGSTGTWLMRDSTRGYTVAVEQAANYMATRVYSADGTFHSGALAFDVNGQRLVSPMRFESDVATDGRTNTVPMLVESTGRARAEQRARPSAANDDINCAPMFTELVGGPSRFASNAGSALDAAESLADGFGAPSPPSIVARASHFFSDLLGRIPSLCPDAPQPVSEVEFDRAAVVGGYDAIFDTDTQEVLNAFSTAESVREKLAEAAERALERVRGVGPAGFVSTESPALPTLVGTAETTVAALDGNKRAVPMALSCISAGPWVPVVTYGADGLITSFRYSIAFTNTCGFSVNVLYCQTTTSCTPNNFRALGAGGTFSVLGRETVNDRQAIPESVFSMACPDQEDGQPVYPDGRDRLRCYRYL